MFEPDNVQKIQMMTGQTVSKGQCIQLGTENLETKFRDGNTEVRFMRNAEGGYTSIALENEERNVFAYWAEGHEVMFMLSDGTEFGKMCQEMLDEMGICF